MYVLTCTKLCANEKKNTGMKAVTIIKIEMQNLNRHK